MNVTDGSVLVVDSSLYASLLVGDKYYHDAKRFFSRHVSTRLVTVSIAYVEVANVLWKHTFILGRIDEKDYSKLSKIVRKTIESLSSEIVKAEKILEDALQVAAECRVAVYDALFVATALKYGGKLATFDEALQKRVENCYPNLIIVPKS